MSGNSIAINVFGVSESDCPARICELYSLKKILVEWGMDETEAKTLALRLVYGTSVLRIATFDPQKPQSEQ